MTTHDIDAAARGRARSDRTARRSFLISSATVLAGIAVAGGTALRNRPDRSLAAIATDPGPKLSVGFVDTNSTSGQLDWASRPTVVPARGAPSTSLVGAIGSVDGMTPGAVADHQLDVLLAAPGTQEPNHFVAWAVSNGSTSHPVDFAIPTGDLELGFELAENGVTRHTVLTRSMSSSLPTLAVGTYLIGLEPDVWAARTQVPAPGDTAWDDLASVMVSIRHT